MDSVISAPDSLAGPSAAERVTKIKRFHPLLALGCLFFLISTLGLDWALYNTATLTKNDDSTLHLLALLILSQIVLAALSANLAMRATRATTLFNSQTKIGQLQKRLTYREDLLRLVADNQPGSISIFDRQNRYWFVNKHATESMGKSASEVVGKTPSKVLTADRAKRLEARLAEARSSEKGVDFVDPIVIPGGETRFYQSNYILIEPFAELTGGVLVTEDDLTSLIIERERRERMFRQVIETLVAVVDRRDPYAAGHSSRVGQLSRIIANEMRAEPQVRETAEIAGSLMNFGKVLVPREILIKKSTLTPEELKRVRDSILTSADILSIIGFDGPVVPTLRQVLEKVDGTGVPLGLKGDEILLTARIVAVANAFVALISPRAHRGSMTIQNALAIVTEEADKSYDRQILDTLASYLGGRTNKLDWLMENKQG